jgi:FtsZ-binding cell division protein ZapB
MYLFLTRSTKASFLASVESCQSEVCEVKRDMIAIKHEIDSVQLVKDEIDDIRESLDRLEAESQRRKNKLLEQARKVFINEYRTEQVRYTGMLRNSSKTAIADYWLVSIKNKKPDKQLLFTFSLPGFLKICTPLWFSSYST